MKTRLTNDDMKAIWDTIAQEKAAHPELSGEAAAGNIAGTVLVQVYRRLMGDEAFEAATSINPSHVALAADQVQVILRAVMAAVDPECRTVVNLMWLNHGPKAVPQEGWSTDRA